MPVFELILTILVLLGIAVAILLFERQRAERIERDLADQARRRPRPEEDDDPGSGS